MKNCHFVQVAYDRLTAELEKASDEESQEELEILKDARHSLVYCRSAVSADPSCATAIATELEKLKSGYTFAYHREAKDIIRSIQKDVCELLVQCTMRIYEELDNPYVR